MAKEKLNGVYLSNGQFVTFTDIKKMNQEETIATRENAAAFDGDTTLVLENPDPVLKKMGSDITVYKDLLSDPKVTATTNSRRAGLTGMQHSLDRGIESSSKNLQFYEDVLNRINIKRLIKSGFDGILYGYKPAEINLTTISEGSKIYVVPLSIIAKPSEWFTYDGLNNLRFLSKNEKQEGEIVPPEKFLVFRNEATEENPFGIGILSKVFWSVTFKKNGWRFWMTFLEKYGMPWAVAKHPIGAGDGEKYALLNTLETMVQDAVAVIPDNNSIELKDSPFKGSSNIGYEKVLDKCNSEISLAIVGQTLTSELSGGTGSYSAGSVHKEVLDEIIDDDKEVIETEINKLLQLLALWNFGDINDAPLFTMHRGEALQKGKAERDKIIKDTGDIAFTIEYYQKNYGFSDDDIVAVQKVEESTDSGFSEFKKKYLNFSAVEDQEELDSLEKQFQGSKNYSQQLTPMLQPVLDMIEKSVSFEEVEEGMKTIYPQMNSDQLSEQLSKAIFLSQGLGVINSEEE